MDRVISRTGWELNGADRKLWTAGIAWGVFVYLFHKIGTLTGMYLQYGWFQNATHAASASGVALLVGIFGLHLGVRERRLLVFVIVLTAAGAVGWEIVEYFGLLDAYGVWLHFHDFHDATIDMLSNAVGTAGALTVLYWHTDFDPESLSLR